MHITFRRLLVIGTLLLCGSWCSALAQHSEAASPTIRSLEKAIQSNKTGALNDFWRKIQDKGTPLVEASNHPDSLLITFVHRGGEGMNSVRLSSALNALLIKGIEQDFKALGKMQRMGSTDLWYLSMVVGRDVRVSYRFELAGGTEVRDSLNPHIYRDDRPAIRASLLELPDAPPQPWNKRKGELGSWKQLKVKDIHGGENDAFVYLPVDFDRDRVEPYPVLVGLDSYSFGIGMPGAHLLDHLISTKAIPPTVMVAANLPQGDGLEQMETAAEYVANRLLPELRSELNVTSDPGKVVISGTSRRGLIAAYTAFVKPEAVGNVVALSGSFYWKPDNETEYEWLTHRFATEEIRPVRLFVSAGTLETVVTPGNHGHYMVATNRHLRDILLARGYDFEYWEFAGTHSDLSWQDALARGLVRLLSN